MRAKVEIDHYGKSGGIVKISDPNGNLEGVIYIDKNGHIHCDSWLRPYILSISRKNKSKTFNPSLRV